MEVQTMSWDYTGSTSKEHKSEQIESLPICVGVEGLQWECAHMVPKKGVVAHAIEVVSRETRLAVRSRLVLKPDQEPVV